MSVDGDVGTVLIDRPAKANSLTIEMWVALREVLLVLESRGDVGAVVVRGAGSRHFSAGADLDAVAFAAADAAVATELADAVVDALATFASLSKPSLAVLNGTAAGGGAEIAIAADFRVAAPHASWVFPMRSLAVTIDAVSVAQLRMLVGPHQAKRLLLVETVVDATGALELGLVDEIVAVEALDDRASEIATTLASTPGDLWSTVRRELRPLPLDGEALRAARFDMRFGLQRNRPTTAMTGGRP